VGIFQHKRATFSAQAVVTTAAFGASFVQTAKISKSSDKKYQI
jgi:hypothetical protein